LLFKRYSDNYFIFNLLFHNKKRILAALKKQKVAQRFFKGVFDCQRNQITQILTLFIIKNVIFAHYPALGPTKYVPLKAKF
jgi:hypothetical protein